MTGVSGEAISNKIVDKQKITKLTTGGVNQPAPYLDCQINSKEGCGVGMGVAIHGGCGGCQNMAGQQAASSNKIVDNLKQIAILTKHNKLTTGAIKRPAPFVCGQIDEEEGCGLGHGFCSSDDEGKSHCSGGRL